MTSRVFTHAQLVQRAVRWLKGAHKCTTVYSEMTTGALEWPDAIGWVRGYSRVVECKVSRADFQKDKKTKFGARYPEMGMGIQRWYLVPPDLVFEDEVPEWCGLAYAHPRSVEVIKQAPNRQKWDAVAEAQMLTSAVRRLELGSLFDRKTCRWESYTSRIARQHAEKKK